MSGLVIRLARLEEGIDRACARAGREPTDVLLLAVSKGQPVGRIREALAAGVSCFGENYAQELVEKRRELPEADWHFIGHVQTNKARYLVPGVSLVHSLASSRAAVALGKRALKHGASLSVLLEVNSGVQEGRTGITPKETLSLGVAVEQTPGVSLEGLMAMPPPARDPEETRPHFVRVRALRDRLAEQLGRTLPVLSMGMSGDYQVAIEEGATIVRVGTGLFGPRPAAQRGQA